MSETGKLIGHGSHKFCNNLYQISPEEPRVTHKFRAVSNMNPRYGYSVHKPMLTSPRKGKERGKKRVFWNILTYAGES